MVERPPRTVEYICLSCGAQGLTHIDEEDSDERNKTGGPLLRCPKCGKQAMYLERETAEERGRVLVQE